LGIHSYLSYLRDRLLIGKELLTESGSCFVQIGEENVHLVRNLMDEVFGSENFVSQIIFEKTRSQTSELLAPVCDYIIWYAKSKDSIKYRQLFQEKEFGEEGTTQYKYCESPDAKIQRSLTKDELANIDLIPKGWEIYSASPVVSESGNSSGADPILFKGKDYFIKKGSWKTNKEGFKRLESLNRLLGFGNTLMYKRYYNDFPFMPRTNIWDDVFMTGFSEAKMYIVQTSAKAIQRCLLMTTDPGDLVLDPTCGSGTTAYVAEQWGRRWITIDTSRIALNIAKQRLMTAVFPYYNLYDEKGGDIRQGFKYKTVPHITLKSLANDEPPATETLYDQPELDKKLLRVSGPFTVETLQNFEPVSPEELDDEVRVNEEEGAFEEVIKQHLVSAGIKNGRKDEMVVFRSVELLSHSYLHAEGFYMNGVGEKKAYFHIGPKFGTVSKNAVNEAVKECRIRGDAGWLIVLGFSFESDIEGATQTTSMGKFEVTKCRIHDDLLQEGLKKKPAKSAASFVTIGEPDIDLVKKGKEVTVEIKGLDIYDPIKDEVKPRNVHDIAYWMVDDDYDGSNFVVTQVFFCGGDKDEFDKWRKGLDNLAKDTTKKKVEKTLKIEIDDEAFDRLYGHISHPIEIKKKGQKIAVRVISQFGEETTKVIAL
jgi:adenine-specific DNA-methyltransferase